MNYAKMITMLNNVDVLIVGAGFTGATYAEQLTSVGYSVAMIDKRDHIAGNAYTENIDGIDVHVYGAHIFHTPDQKIWEYVNSFGKFNDYSHHVLANYNGSVYSLPFTLKTLSEIYEHHLSPEEGRALIDRVTDKHKNEKLDNLEAKALSLVGQRVYNTLIRDYTKKQWGKDPKALDPNIITRLPVRMNYDTRYFNDKYQGIPEKGYTDIIGKMISGIDELFLGVNWFDIRDDIKKPFVIYTGPVDEFFDYKHGKLQWRSVKFENEWHSVEDYQGIAVMNYTDDSVPYTRIIEHKHFNPKPGIEYTVVSKETSCHPDETVDPYYPINQAEDRLKMALYNIEKEKIANRVHICGRLGDYKYLDMHQAIGIVLKKFDRIDRKIKDFFLQ